jgi:hypothetical protein
MRKPLILLLIYLALLPLCIPFEVMRPILLGWFFFLVRTVPRMTVDWPSVFVGGVALVLFLLGVHALGRSWQRYRNAEGQGWKFRWSLGTVVVVFLLFAAGICVVGIVHQVGWMVTSHEPYYVQTTHWTGQDTSRNNLKQIGQALMNYCDTFQERFPPGGTFTADGHMLHSWETSILPFFPYATSEINFHLPWNHPRNEKYFQCIIPQFINEGLSSAPALDDHGFGLSHYAANSRLLSPNKVTKIGAIADGTANTLLVGEVNAEFKPWGHPVNCRDPAKGINRSSQGFGGPRFAGGAYFSMADGSVRFLSERTEPVVLRALSTPDGGEEVDATTLPTAR